MAEIHIGTQGWTNRAWVGPFYPNGIPRESMLAVYSQAFDTVEVNRSFHHMPTDPEIRDWYAMVGSNFKFAMRVPQQVTHELRLREAGQVLAKFLGRVENLKEKLGPILLQLPPDFDATDDNKAALSMFLKGLPAEFAWAVEFRNRGWFGRDVCEVLAERNIALVLADGRWVNRDEVIATVARARADWLYLRWHGVTGKPLTDFSRAQEEKSEILSQWASVLWPLVEKSASVYGYFSDQFEGHAPHSARVFQRMMGQVPVDPGNLRLEIAVETSDT